MHIKLPNLSLVVLIGPSGAGKSCCDELEELLGRLGYERMKDEAHR